MQAVGVPAPRTYLEQLDGLANVESKAGDLVSLHDPQTPFLRSPERNTKCRPPTWRLCKTKSRRKMPSLAAARTCMAIMRGGDLYRKRALRYSVPRTQTSLRTFVQQIQWTDPSSASSAENGRGWSLKLVAACTSLRRNALHNYMIDACLPPNQRQSTRPRA